VGGAMKVQIISPDGKKGYVPIDNIGKAIERGFQIVPGGNVTPIIQNDIPVPQQNKIRVMSPEGRFGYIDPQKLESAVSKGFKPAPASAIEPPTKESWAGLIGKSALKVPMSLLDIPKAAVGLAQTAYNNQVGLPYDYFAERYNAPPRPNIDIASKIPGSDTAREFIQDKTGVDLTPRPEGSAQRIVGNAIEWATPLGLAGRGANLANRATQSARLAATGAGIGTTSGVLQEVGVDPLVADIGSSIVAPNPANLLKNFSKAKEGVKALPLKFMGLDPKNFNLQAAKAARDLGIDLPSSVFTESNTAAYLDQLIGKSPFYGNKLRNKYATAEEAIYKTLNNIYDSVGPIKTQEINDRINQLYRDSKNHLSDSNAGIKPFGLESAAKKIIEETDIPAISPNNKVVRNTAQEIISGIEPTSQLFSSHGVIKLPLQDIPIKKLIEQKANLNDMIPWDKITTGDGSRARLIGLQQGALKDLKKYGELDPAWWNQYNKGERLYEKTEKRKKVEDLIGNTATNYATDKISFNALSKALNRPKNKKILQANMDEETFAKAKKLGKVAKAMAVKNQNTPNPSGTAMTAATLGLVSRILTNPVETFRSLGLGIIAGTPIATKLLTDKKIVDMAMEMAQKPNKPELPKIAAFNKRVKDLTGYSTVTLMRNIDNQEQTEGLDYGL
jgi:hypothetical protein